MHTAEMPLACLPGCVLDIASDFSPRAHNVLPHSCQTGITVLILQVLGSRCLSLALSFSFQATVCSAGMMQV